MIQTIDNTLSVTRAVVRDQDDDKIVLELPGSEYQLHLLTPQGITPDANRRVTGVIRAQARRVDVVRTGGRFIEPVYGRPRRVQGTVVATDVEMNTITVRSSCPFVCRLDQNQKPGDFEVGSLVGFDIDRGATFEPLPS